MHGRRSKHFLILLFIGLRGGTAYQDESGKHPTKLHETNDINENDINEDNFAVPGRDLVRQVIRRNKYLSGTLVKRSM